jgi:uncharacterized protein YjeT (DUF2065 family)
MTLILLSCVLVTCLLAAAAYIVFGILHMVVPKATLRIYRRVLGLRAWQRAEPAFLAMTQRTWKLLGAFDIACGLLLVWALMHTAGRLLSTR